MPYPNQIDLNDAAAAANDFLIAISGRIMLISLILMCISRMYSLNEWLNGIAGGNAVIQFILDNFVRYKYVHLILAWFGVIFCCFVHITFICLRVDAISYEIEFGEYDPNTISIYDIVRMSLALIAIFSLIFSNCGGTYYTKYSTSMEGLNRKRCNCIASILCNQTFDYGHNKKRYKLFHILSYFLLLIVIYANPNYVGVHYVISFFLLLSIIDRFHFLGAFGYKRNKKVFASSDLSVLPIDHQFKILYVNDSTKFQIEPGDIFYLSSGVTFSRPSIFFSKNNYDSIGCILRVHRNNTLSHSMERVKWNFNFLEQILDDEIMPTFRGPYRNESIYNRLVTNLTYPRRIDEDNHVQYLFAVDEGIAYQIEYLTYLQAHNYKQMPCPTHIIFATSSKSLFDYVCTNLQLLFIEIQDLTVECKLLPSNINLIPNTDEMVQYYINEKVKQFKKEKENNHGGDDEFLLNGITQREIVEEMEFDILQYLSIPHILYHHNLKDYYQNHPHSKLSHKLRQKYEAEPADNDNDNDDDEQNRTIPSEYNFNEAIQIEMYYAGIPFVSNLLNSVCTTCRIPYFTQKIY